MTGKQRRAFLYAALAGVASWSAWLALNEQADDAGAERVEMAKPATRAQAPATRVTEPIPAPAPSKSQETVPRLALARTNLFPEQTWFIPPPPPPHPPYVAPPPPQAPALPYRYMGRWQEAGQTTYYLTRGNTPLSVRAGQVLEGAWRLEPVANGMLNFTYLPLNQTRSLRTGD
jgi:hypothetical protein